MDSGDIIDKVVMIGCGAALAAIITGSLVLPIFNKILGQLTAETYENISDIATISSLMWFVLVIVVVGVIVAMLRYAASRDR